MNKAERRVLYLFVLIICVSGCVLSGRAQGSISWFHNYQQGVQEAKKTNRPMLIDFWAQWCGPCRKMDEEVWNEPKIVTLSRKFVCVSIDVDRDESTALAYRTSAIPKTVVTDPWANTLAEREGFLLPGELADLLTAIPGDFSSIAAATARLKEDKDDFQAWFMVGEFYRKLGILDLSTRYLKGALKASVSPERERAWLMLGLNNLKLNDAKAARKAFEQCLKEFGSAGGLCDQALVGLVTALASDHKIDEAEKALLQLQAQFPGSPAARIAAENLQTLKARQ